MKVSTSAFLLLALGLAALAMAVFVPGLPGGFLLDDSFNIQRNRILYVDDFNIEHFIYAALNFHDGTGSRALPMLSFALDYWRAGAMDPATFKITNIAIQGLSALVLAFGLRRLLLLAHWSKPQAAWGALLLAFIWAIHPLQVSSVLYVVQRMQTMANLFIILALWAYLAMRQKQMEGGRGRWQGILVVIAWLLGLMCKEDAVLLPLYTLALELTLLRFAAGQAVVARGLRQSYGLMFGLGLLLFVCYALPRYWSWDAYSGRDFSSIERLLTQGRVLVMYLKQILLPWPDWMLFNYDDLEVSRGLLAPWTTLPALLLLAGLLGWAWHWRHTRPLFAFGLFFFFAGHFLTSNVIGLELVFEHRNHLPLLGILLALADLLRLLPSRLASLPLKLTFFVLGLTFLGSATLVRAHAWGDPVRLGETFIRISPHSGRAWTGLGNAWFDLYNQTKEPKYLEKALEVAEQSFARVSSMTLAGNVILYRAMLGRLAEADWQRFYESLRQSPPGWQRHQAVDLLLANANKGFIQDREGVLQAMQLLLELEPLSFFEALKMGDFAYASGWAELSMSFFRKAAAQSKGYEFYLQRLLDELGRSGHGDWADELRAIQAGQAGKP